jgi:diaminobutyrate-2-oxoglutarate transaminase
MSFADEQAPEAENAVFRRLESNVQSYARTFPNIWKKALNAELWDIHGRRYLDFLAGAGSLNYGHNNPILKQALLDYIASDGMTHSLDLHTTAKESFLQAMEEIILAPRGLDYVVQFTGPTGTNAVEAALKIARKVTGRTNIISFTNGFHGVSVGALAATGNQHFRRAAGVALQGVTVMPYDGYFGSNVDTIAYMDRMLSDPSSGVDDPAAVIIELVQGEGGLNTARLDWLKRLQALCNRKNILLIVDDVQAGCGRTGTFFSFEAAGLKPDIVTMSKSISGYGVPFAIVLIERSIDKWRPGEHNGTFRGNNHAFVTGTAAFEHYWRTPDFAREVQERIEQLDHRLNHFVDRFSGDILEARGRGMMRGVVVADPDLAADVTTVAFRNGLIIERAGSYDEVVKFLMPLTIGAAELDEGLDILERSFEEVFSSDRARKPQASASVLPFSSPGNR